MTVIAAESALELGYYLTTTLNNGSPPTAELLLTSKSDRTGLTDTMNITIDSEWTAHFVAQNASDMMYKRNAVVGSFRINRNVDSSYRLNGFLRCYFCNQGVSVLIAWNPLLEIAAATLGIMMITTCLTYRYRSQMN